MQPVYSVPRVGVGVVIRRGNEVLLGKRRGSHGAGEWALPGGRIDPGEAGAVTAARELAEETGLSAVNLRWLPMEPTNDLFPVEGQHWITQYYLADWDGQKPQVLEPHKCEGWQWFSWNDLPSPLFAGVLALRAQFPNLTAI